MPSTQAWDLSSGAAVAVDKTIDITAAIESITNVKSPNASNNNSKNPLHSTFGFSLL